MEQDANYKKSASLLLIDGYVSSSESESENELGIEDNKDIIIANINANIEKVSHSDSSNVRQQCPEPTEDNRVNNELEDSHGVSDMVIKNNILNVAKNSMEIQNHNDNSEHIIESNANRVIEYEVTEYRDIDTDETLSSDSSSSDVLSVKEIDDLCSSDEDDVIEITNKDGKRPPLRVRGELGMEDLPPIEDLAISVPQQECTEIGHIWNIVDTLVIIQAKPNMPAIDLESVMFLEKGAKPLGKVFDVFGPVTEPYYCVRFNSSAHIIEKGIQKGMEVYVAPKTDYTHYVFVSELMKMKGSDASWLHDVEPPLNQLDYSDDEEERSAKKAHKAQNKGETNKEQQTETTNEKKRPKLTKFEEQMNRKNLQRTAESNRRFGNPTFRTRNPFSSSSPSVRPQNGNPFMRYNMGGPFDPSMSPLPQGPPPGFGPIPNANPIMPNFNIPSPMNHFGNHNANVNMGGSYSMGMPNRIPPGMVNRPQPRHLPPFIGPANPRSSPAPFGMPNMPPRHFFGRPQFLFGQSHWFNMNPPPPPGT